MFGSNMVVISDSLRSNGCVPFAS